MVKDEELMDRALRAFKKLLELVFKEKSIILEPDVWDNSYTLSINDPNAGNYTHTHSSLFFDEMNEKNLKRSVDQLIGDILEDRPGLSWHTDQNQNKEE